MYWGQARSIDALNLKNGSDNVAELTYVMTQLSCTFDSTAKQARPGDDSAISALFKVGNDVFHYRWHDLLGSIQVFSLASPFSMQSLDSWCTLHWWRSNTTARSSLVRPAARSVWLWWQKGFKAMHPLYSSMERAAGEHTKPYKPLQLRSQELPVGDEKL